MKLFVSYNRDDRTAVNRIVAELGGDAAREVDRAGAPQTRSDLVDEDPRPDRGSGRGRPRPVPGLPLVRGLHPRAEVRRGLPPAAGSGRRSPFLDVALPGELASVEPGEWRGERVAALLALPENAALQFSKPDRGRRRPFCRTSCCRTRMSTKRLEMEQQFGIIAELHLYSRSPDPAERAWAAGSSTMSAKSPHLFAAPARLLQEWREEKAPTTPWTAILGAALGGIGLTNLLIVIGVYRIVPRPLDFVTPNVVLALLGAILCSFALRRHLVSALIGLAVCLVSIAGAAYNLLKYFHKI